MLLRVGDRAEQLAGAEALDLLGGLRPGELRGFADHVALAPLDVGEAALEVLDRDRAAGAGALLVDGDAPRDGPLLRGQVIVLGLSTSAIPIDRRKRSAPLIFASLPFSPPEPATWRSTTAPGWSVNGSSVADSPGRTRLALL